MNRYIIDVREPEEYATGHVENALNIPPSELMRGTKTLAAIPKDAEVILYCKTGSRSQVSMNIMKTMGYTNVINGVNKDQVLAKYGS